MQITVEHEREAWEAMNAAIRRERYVEPGTGKVWYLKNWQIRHAPSVGARAGAILRNLMYPPSYISACEIALALYLSDEQMSERRGFYRPRRSNASQVFTGVRHFG